MTDNKEDKPKLKLGSKLTLNRSIDPEKLKQSFLSKGTVVEVKNNKLATKPSTRLSSSEGSLDSRLTDTELNKRLTLLKNAAKNRQEQENSEDTGRDLSPARPAKALEVAQPEEQVVSETPAVEDTPTSVPTPADLESAVEAASHAHHPKKSKAAELAEEEEAKAKGKILAEEAEVKAKVKEQPRKLKKTDIINMLGDDDEERPGKQRSLASIKRAREKAKKKQQDNNTAEKVYREVIIPDIITVGELANRMAERSTDVIKELMKLGVIANVNQVIDEDTAELVVAAMGHTSKRVKESDVEIIADSTEDTETTLKPRAPVVTVMGHVDHGKTSLLDALKSTDVVASEAGGITQHIGAYKVNLANGHDITFIDTPGHEAFTEMRTRGAKITDIVVLVVAADDGIKAQTVEAINHAKAAGVPIIVAINKIDKPAANVDRVKTELLQYELVSEDLGGDIMMVEVSALKKLNLDKLEEAILLLAEMLELKANPDAPASGAVIESRVDKTRGPVSTILVERGTLKVGDIVIAGSSVGRVKKMIDHKGNSLETAGPSTPIEVLGLDSAPLAGDPMNVVETEKKAREIAEYRERKLRERKTSAAKKMTLDDLFSKASGTSTLKDLPVIIKGDVQGSVEAIVASLEKIESDEVKVKPIHTGVGGISESDVTLARASNALVVGFNVRAMSAAEQLAEKEGVDIRYYSIIYNLIDDIKAIMSGMLTPIKREEYIGSVDIREVFNITKVGKVAGCYVTKGIIKRGAGVRLLRDSVVIHEGKLKTLKRFKDEVKEVRENFECGIAFENYDDIKAGDRVEVFEIVEEQKTL